MMHDDLLLLSMRSDGWAGDAALRGSRLSADLELLDPISDDLGRNVEKTAADIQPVDGANSVPDYVI
jgi:hypothetical protein